MIDYGRSITGMLNAFDSFCEIGDPLAGYLGLSNDNPNEESAPVNYEVGVAIELILVGN